MPIQPSGAYGVRGTVEVFPEYAAGLKDLNGFSHIILIYHFHEAVESQLIVTPFLDSKPRGVFSTRAPKRPNPVGNVDILDGTPLLDIKPYVPEFDQHPADRVGWLGQAKGKVHSKKSDDRFR